MAERAGVISELDDINELVRLHQARIRRFVTCSTGDPDLADTITQDTLLRAFKGRESFRGDCSLSTWLTGTQLTPLLDGASILEVFKATAVEYEIFPAPKEWERRMLAQERVKELYGVLETLSYNQRTIFLMKFSEEMSVDEISEILGMGVNTVRTHLHRALKAVRSKLGAKL
jgi:RNA polymerase sigma-70 factor (ECF subfamily)